MKNETIRKLVLSAMFAALCCVATMIVQIPTVAGYTNLGECMCLLAGLVLGPWYGLFAAGIGSGLADLLAGYAHYVPGTFLIKGLVALIAALLLRPLLKKIYLLLPLVILVYLVSSGSRTMAFAAAIATVTAIVVSMFSKETRMTPKKFFEALAGGTQGCISVGVACGIAGVVAGCLTMTGLANDLINAIVRISGDAKLLALALTMLCCIVLGMGVPTTANYCIMATTCAPILVKMGIPTIAAHFFVFYFGIVADLTPPVALAAYAGAAIAGANPMKTALNATKLAIAAFIIPYILAYNPAMVLVDTSVAEILVIAITSLIGMFGIGMALEGYYRGSLPWYLRILSAVGGLCLVYPGLVTDVIGIVLVGSIIALQVLRDKKTPKTA